MIEKWTRFCEGLTWREFGRLLLLVFLGADAVGLAVNITLTMLVPGY